MCSSGELFIRSREVYFGVYFPSCEAMREINTKITLEWAHKPFSRRVHTLFYFLHNQSINNNKNGDLHTLVYILLMTSQWPDNSDVITWILISNSLDIDFIHSNIHGRSCKKNWTLFLGKKTIPHHVSSGFPSQRASKVESVSMSWYLHAIQKLFPSLSQAALSAPTQ